MTEPSTEPIDPRLIPCPVPEHARVEREWPGTPDTASPWDEPEDAICHRCGDDSNASTSCATSAGLNRSRASRTLPMIN